ncbi:MAG TPA: hypothetical protein VLK53_09345 [Gaiellaceae bacterium]|nr:hypothetical protein [Gaiellaceae bacterium]
MALGTVTLGVVALGTVTLGVVTPGVVTLGTVTPGVVTLGTVTPGVVTPGVATLGVVTPGAVTPGAVTALTPAAPGAVPPLAGACAAAGEWEVAPTGCSAPPVTGRCTETEAEGVAAVAPAAAGRALAR